MTEKNWLQKLTKSDSDKWIGGVCGGLGEHSPIPSWVWRVLFVLFFFGPGLFLYILLWIFVPSKSKTQE